MAMNLYSQGIDPTLDLSGMAEITEVVEACTEDCDSSAPPLRRRTGVYGVFR